ncbi:hypothetical protein ACFLZB_04885 [Nanoarchaeota archaeon]
MGLKEFLKPTPLKIGLAIFLTFVNATYTMCLGGPCYGFPFTVFTTQLNLLPLFLNLAIYIVVAWLIMWPVDAIPKTKQWMKYIALVGFFWLSLFILHLIEALVRSGGYFDPDVLEIAILFPTIKTGIFFFPLILFWGLIAWLISLFKQMKEPEPQEEQEQNLYITPPPTKLK